MPDASRHAAPAARDGAARGPAPAAPGMGPVAGTRARPGVPGHEASALAERNRRTAGALVGWILALAAAAVLVAWLRN